MPLNPGRVHQALTSYQLAMALKGALDLDIFTHISLGASTAESIAGRCQATVKGTRVLCDYLTVQGFLSKSGDSYALLEDTGELLDRNSPSYIGSVASFFTHPVMVRKYSDVAALVRNGGAVDHTLAPNEPVWVDFARYMAPMFDVPARLVAPQVTQPGVAARVLDIAAGHGLFGIHVGLYNPQAEITFQDWPNVLEVAEENAVKLGLADRYRTIPGSAFEVELGADYDVVLLPNFLHHFDYATNLTLLRRVYRALKPGGVAAVIEFVPNDDRISPPDGALFAMRMLGTTPSGDAYTFAELARMLHESGFGQAEARSLAPAHQQLILARATP